MMDSAPKTPCTEHERHTRELLEAQVQALRTEIGVRLDASDKAVDSAAITLGIRLDHANGVVAEMMRFQREMRDTMVHTLELRPLIARIDKLEKAQAMSAGQKKGTEPLMAVILIVVAALVAATVAKLT